MLGSLLKKYFSCSPERFNDVLSRVQDALKELKISAVPPQLALELARYYEHQFDEECSPAELRKNERKLQKTIRQAELYRVLPAEAEPLISAGILQVNSISPLFPCIRFVFEISTWAKMLNIHSPVMELELVGPLFEIGALLDICRKSIDDAFADGNPLPVNLNIPDMSDFVVFYLGGERLRFHRAGRDTAKMISAGFSGDLYKITLT